MPRYRFSWSNLDAVLLRALADDCRLEGDPADALRAAFGARPKEEFIRQTWPVLLGVWLTDNRRACARLATMLRARGVGDLTIGDDLSYLRSVRNTTATRKLAIELFIEAGEQTAMGHEVIRSISTLPADGVEVMEMPEQDVEVTPAHPDEDDEDDVDEGPETLVDFLGRTLCDLYGSVAMDTDGDFVLPNGSAIVYVSPLSEPEAVRIFSVLVREVPETLQVYLRMNEINLMLPFGRLAYLDGRIYLEQILLPMGLNNATLAATVGTICNAADYYDHRLQTELGGQTALRERADDEIEV